MYRFIPFEEYKNGRGRNGYMNVPKITRKAAIFVGRDNDGFEKFRDFVKKIFRRSLIWVVALAIAFYVPIRTCGIPGDLEAWQHNVIAKNKFSDVFLAVVAMVVLSGSDLADGIIANRSAKIGSLTKGCAWVIFVIYFIFIVYGMGEFGSVESSPPNPPWGLLKMMLLIGIVGEFIIASVPD